MVCWKFSAFETAQKRQGRHKEKTSCIQKGPNPLRRKQAKPHSNQSRRLSPQCLFTNLYFPVLVQSFKYSLEILAALLSFNERGKRPVPLLIPYLHMRHKSSKEQIIKCLKSPAALRNVTDQKDYGKGFTSFLEEAERLKLAVPKGKTFNMHSSVKIIHWVKFNHSKERRSLVCLQLFTNVFWL